MEGALALGAMNDREEWDAMEASMGRALRTVRRKQIGMDVLIALLSFLGGAVGIGWTAKTYLARIEGDIEKATFLLAAQAEQLKVLGDSTTRAHDRVAVCEKTQAVDEKAFEDLKESVRDIELRSGTIVRGHAGR